MFLKSGLIREVAFDGNGLILKRGVTFDWKKWWSLMEVAL
jgi:hypothetical protein